MMDSFLLALVLPLCFDVSSCLVSAMMMINKTIDRVN